MKLTEIVHQPEMPLAYEILKKRLADKKPVQLEIKSRTSAGTAIAYPYECHPAQEGGFSVGCSYQPVDKHSPAFSYYYPPKYYDRLDFKTVNGVPTLYMQPEET